MADAQKTLYVSRAVLNPLALLAWAKKSGFKKTLPGYDMHVTVAYSSKKLFWPKPALEPVTIAGSRNRIVKPLGDEGAVVLGFSDPGLHRRWQALCDQGASWDFDGYQPHVTITYSGGAMKLESITPYAGPIALGPECFEEVDEGATSRAKASETR
jgi:hypothetical protein